MSELRQNVRMQRSLEVRITEYRDNLLSIADQLQTVIDQVAAQGHPIDPTLPDGVKLYRLIGEDLTKVIAGEELKPFAVTGEL